MLKNLGSSVDIPSLQLYTLTGKAATEIQRMAEDLKTDLIVVASYGRSVWRRALGSTGNAAFHSAHCDVLAGKIKK